MRRRSDVTTTPQPDAPIRYIDAHGVQRLFGRRTGFVVAKPPTDADGPEPKRRYTLYCPSGHAIDLQGLPVNEDRSVRCHECRACILLIGGMETSTGDHVISTVEVTADELHWMERRRMRRIEDVVAYLGLHWSRPPNHA